MDALRRSFPGLRLERSGASVEWFVKASRALAADGLAIPGSLSLDMPCDEDTAELLDAMAYANDPALGRKPLDAAFRGEASFLNASSATPSTSPAPWPAATSPSPASAGTPTSPPSGASSGGRWSSSPRTATTTTRARTCATASARPARPPSRPPRARHARPGAAGAAAVARRRPATGLPPRPAARSACAAGRPSTLTEVDGQGDGPIRKRAAFPAGAPPSFVSGSRYHGVGGSPSGRSGFRSSSAIPFSPITTAWGPRRPAGRLEAPTWTWSLQGAATASTLSPLPGRRKPWIPVLRLYLVVPRRPIGSRELDQRAPGALRDRDLPRHSLAIREGLVGALRDLPIDDFDLGERPAFAVGHVAHHPLPVIGSEWPGRANHDGTGVSRP